MEGYRRIVYIIGLIGALGGLLFGLDQGFIANSLSTIRSIYHLDLLQSEHYAGILALGCIIGVLFSGWITRTLGRKKALIISGFIFSVLSLVSMTLPPLPILMAARAGLGFAVGLASFAVPLYLAETAPTSIRGGMSSLFQLMITIGIFVIAVTNISINKWLGFTSVSLMTMFSVIAFFSAVMFFAAFFLPESPRWLVMKGKYDQARKSLSKMYSSTADVETRIAEIKGNLGDKNEGKKGVRFLSLLKEGFFLKVLFMGVVLQMFQQLVGINMMIYYSPIIFGYAKMTGVLVLLLVPTVNMLFTIPAVRWIEKWGRKKLLYMGSMVMMVAMFAAGFAFLSMTHQAAPGAFERGVLLASVIVYIFGFACSWGPVAWVICSEIFPQKGRELGLTITTMVNWTFAGLVMSNGLTFMHTYGNASIFFLFGGFCILSLVFLKFFVPETKGVSLERIEKDLCSGVRLNKIGQDANNYGANIDIDDVAIEGRRI